MHCTDLCLCNISMAPNRIYNCKECNGSYTENDSSTQKVEENDGSGGNRVSEESSLKQSVIFSDNGATPYVVDSNMPKVQGVVVVAEGADDAKIVSEITDAVNALLGIPVNRIKVLKMEV